MRTKEDLEAVYGDMCRVINSLSTDSKIKELKHNYFLTDPDSVIKIYQIFAAELRQGLEKVFEHYWDKELLAEVKAEHDARAAKYAGRGRRKAIDSSKDKTNSTQVQTFGKLTIETYED